MTIRRTSVGIPIEPYSTIASALYAFFFLLLLPAGFVFGFIAANETRKNPLLRRSYRMAWKGIRLNATLLVLYFLLPFAHSFLAWLFAH